MVKRSEIEQNGLGQTFRTALGKNVREIRHAAKKSLIELAEETGLSKSELSYIERGERDFGVSYLPILAEALNVPISELIPQPAVNEQPSPQPGYA